MIALAELLAEGWREQALCRQTDPELFFPAPGDPAHQAKRVCRACPVSAACLAHAIRHRERAGIWGGLSPRQRRHLTPEHLATDQPNSDQPQPERKAA